MILLFVYPFYWFQQLLRFNFLTLHIFMDVFQGSYKDGTNGTRDYRYFSALFLFLQLTDNIFFPNTDPAFGFSSISSYLLHSNHSNAEVTQFSSLMWGYLGQAMDQTHFASLATPFLYLSGLVCVAITMMVRKVREESKCFKGVDVILTVHKHVLSLNDLVSNVVTLLAQYQSKVHVYILYVCFKGLQ